MPLAVREAYGFPATERLVGEVRQGSALPDLTVQRTGTPEWHSHSAQQAAEPRDMPAGLRRSLARDTLEAAILKAVTNLVNIT
jgi:hypothetical protein